jgi:hypothetical protein
MPSKVSLVCVDPELIFDVWGPARPLIKAAIDATGISDFADIEHAVLSGDQLLWLAWSDRIEAAATTRLSPGLCTVTACSGQDRQRWLPLFAQIEDYARAEGAGTMRIVGRRGWGRVLDGYSVTNDHGSYVVLEKVL